MTDFRYDVFISYSHKDTWVRDWLLPALEASNLKVCIDFRDFDLGLAAFRPLFRLQVFLRGGFFTLLSRHSWEYP